MNSLRVSTLPVASAPADDAAEEAARALQTALDRRDNGGRPAV
ncbi:hypothetical protein GCM10023085_37950 [Actinomadura viridis]|uniref:Uncharacterized protein n=1 Tax=Actinomadura viridis TaxID=58110 RepID=A0A931DCJ9_9ACTN|nr:hypothetical protein [Actinomadura viridis]MBG6087670.1 hypothetical protein [Actinomadura viridis]